ncbi:DUF6629 family protein [Streptomyces nojiriensis]|uniref:DUF6629 family protein n=1 Tax=Streptomyces nojiriensis TaxID=66374 RepID=UPI00367DF32F
MRSPADPVCRSADRGRPAVADPRGGAGGGAPACSALWWLEFASAWCAFAAVASLVVRGRVRGPYAAPPVMRSTESYLDVCSDFTHERQ